MGVDVAPQPTAREEQEDELRDSMCMAWRWLRALVVDRATSQYFETGDTENLRKFLEPELADRMIAYLDGLRDQGMAAIPVRKIDRDGAEVNIIDRRLNSDGTVEHFVVEESFRDTSGLVMVEGQRPMSDPLIASGDQRMLRATVVCTGPQSYRIRDIRQVSIGE
ncbi:hypothetical protein [Miltoncostaea oceani]|uniref:hypothetical protein n=1 Tax=Miltoncostaea oceani TaxID=2843216 RepID=UPI001C3E5D13|nr:hypothetical protein [Miltoncostaea oceani]